MKKPKPPNQTYIVRLARELKLPTLYARNAQGASITVCDGEQIIEWYFDADDELVTLEQLEKKESISTTSRASGGGDSSGSSS